METYTHIGKEIGPIVISYTHRKNALWGRFGGGWNWALGIRAGHRTVLIQLFVIELTLTWIGFKKN